MRCVRIAVLRCSFKKLRRLVYLLYCYDRAEGQVHTRDEQIIGFLEAMICEWEEAAQFCEQTIQGVQSGACQAKRYRAIIEEIKRLIEQIRNR